MTTEAPKIDMSNILTPLPKVIAGVRGLPTFFKGAPNEVASHLHMTRLLVPRYEELANPDVQGIAELLLALDEVQAQLVTLSATV